MEAFEFTINESFLEGGSHPITIPKGQIPYENLRAINLNHKNILTILPHGERYKSELYHGEAGFGEYYQLRLQGSQRDFPGYLKIGDKVIVFLCISKDRSYAIIEYKD